MSSAAPARPGPPRGATRAAVSPRPHVAGRPDAARQSRPPLRLVDSARPARSSLARPAPLPFALVVAGVLGAGLVALLMLHTLAAQDAFTLHRLQHQSAALADVEQQLTVADQQAQAPSALAARARALGMVPTGALRIIRRRDGRVVAVASALPQPAPAPAASATPSPTPSASSTPAARAKQPTAKPSRATKPPVKHRPPH